MTTKQVILSFHFIRVSIHLKPLQQFSIQKDQAKLVKKKKKKKKKS